MAKREQERKIEHRLRSCVTPPSHQQDRTAPRGNVMRKTSPACSSRRRVVDGARPVALPLFQRGEGRQSAHARPSHTMLIGRWTYDSFAGPWPDREAAGRGCGFREAARRCRKIVCRTKARLSPAELEQLQGDFGRGVTALKNEPGDMRHERSRRSSASCSTRLSSTSSPVRPPDAVRRDGSCSNEGDHPAKLLSSETFSTVCSTWSTARTTHPAEGATRKPKPPCQGRQVASRTETPTTMDTTWTTKIGLIGAGSTGVRSAASRSRTRYDVVISQLAVWPETLTDLVAELGPNARAATSSRPAQLVTSSS